MTKKTLVDHIGANWVKWILFMAITILMGFNTYIVNKVDAIQKDSVVKEDYVREIARLNKNLEELTKRIDMAILKGSITISRKE